MGSIKRLERELMMLCNSSFDYPNENMAFVVCNIEGKGENAIKTIGKFNDPGYSYTYDFGRGCFVIHNNQ